MKRVEYRCENCGNIVYRNVLGNRESVIRMLKIVEKKTDCCEAKDYTDNLGVLDRIRASSAAQMY